jgi:hypothetical protein
LKITKKKTGDKKPPKTLKDNRFKDIVALGEDRVSLIKTMMLDGKSAAHIARVMQQEWGVLTKRKEESLSRLLTRYRKHEVDPKILLQSDALPDDLKNELVSRMQSNLDTLDEMKTVCVEQMARYKVLSITSVRSGKRSDLNAAAVEGQRLHHMLKDLAGLQMDAGIIPRAPRIVSAHVNFARTAAEDAYYQELEIGKDVREKTRSMIAKLSDENIIDAEFEEIETSESDKS